MTDRHRAAIAQWGRALRAEKRVRGRQRRRLRHRFMGVGSLVLALSATMLFPPHPRLLWNTSASAPIGLYRVMPDAPIARGDMVIAWPPYPGRLLAARRGYLPFNVPLIKQVVGMPGDIVCARGARLHVNDRVVVAREARDGAGRPLPQWQGCEGLGPDRYLLLMRNAPASFDGRYFGSSERADIIGRASLLWRRDGQ
ncbi:S26 family signal peptidase [Sphingobium yanoikuyae]|uniref:S26 family signal peptidase n=1 Tax=Sphingobium yanoikuyae TaxID=13690 RepID=UPI00345E3DA7